MKNKEGFVLWFTGLSGAGKSTVADAVFEKLKNQGVDAERLDGDLVREHLTKDLGFSREDRAENIKRVAYVCQLLSKHGVCVVSSFISPYKSEREMVRKMCSNFMEIYVNTPLSVCEKRDVKGLYAKARKGDIENFTGVSDPYEIPKNPEVSICCDGEDPEKKIEENAEKVLEFLKDTEK